MPIGIGTHLGPIYGYHRLGGRRHGLLVSFMALPLWCCGLMLLASMAALKWMLLGCWWLLKWSAAASASASRWVQSTGWPWWRAAGWPWLRSTWSRGRHAVLRWFGRRKSAEPPAVDWKTATMPQEWVVPTVERPEPKPKTTV